MYMYACMCETRDQAKSISLCCAEGTEDTSALFQKQSRRT